MRYPYATWLGAVGLILLAGSPLPGEVFILDNGGRVEGELVNPGQSPRTEYIVQISPGAKIVLARSQVKTVTGQLPAEREYEAIRPAFPDTVDDQWALAEWCRERGLVTHRKIHLQRIIELQPDHEKAHLALRHSRHGGQWMTQQEWMESRGLRQYKGRWLTPQEIELLEQKRVQSDAEKKWFRDLERWEGWLGKPDRALQARKNIEAIKAPAAVRALQAAMRRQFSGRYRELYARALAQIGTPEAIRVLVDSSMGDPDDEVRFACIEHLREMRDQNIASYYVGAIASKDNGTINRAAVALGHLGDPSAVGPLIEALVTAHKFKYGSGSSGSISPTFSSGGGGGLAMGGNNKVVTRYFENRPVLDALAALTGENFGFNEQAWRGWFASKQRANPVDIRRD
ncbi:MAG: HEAT repeat domain-containing protein [Planctomycetes bacterium]|nr:HEAT repeat domain-containing protein [Planctomycetota bacterium]